MSATLLSLAVAAGGCFGSASGTPPTDHTANAHSTGPVRVAGLVYARACAGGIIVPPHPPRTFCAIPYRGEVVFCQTMDQIGPCPDARVNQHGRFAITLPSGRYALIPAPGKGNIVTVHPRWVVIGQRRSDSLTIHGGITAQGLARLSSEV